MEIRIIEGYLLSLGLTLNYSDYLRGKGITRVVEKYKIDILQCEHAMMWRPILSVGKQKKLPTVLTSHNFESSLLIGTKNSFKIKFPPLALLMRAQKSEKEAIMNYDLLTVAVSKRDIERFIAIGIPEEKFVYIPHGMEPIISKMDLRTSAGINKKAPIVLFVGSYHPPNIAACKIILSKIAPKLPQINFVIVGTVNHYFKGKQPNNVFFLQAKWTLKHYIEYITIPK